MSINVQPLHNVLRPVSAMLRECLINANKEIADLDLTRLKLYIPQISATDDAVYLARVLPYNPRDTLYVLDSNQTFTFSRVDADAALTLYGITERTFPKDKYIELQAILGEVGEFVVTDGSLDDVSGNATVVYYFGAAPNSEDGLYPARYIPLLPDNPIKAHYSIPFKGGVTFTFIGDGSEPVDVTPPPETNNETDEKENENRIDLDVVFANRDLTLEVAEIFEAL